MDNIKQGSPTWCLWEPGSPQKTTLVTCRPVDKVALSCLCNYILSKSHCWYLLSRIETTAVSQFMDTKYYIVRTEAWDLKHLGMSSSSFWSTSPLQQRQRKCKCEKCGWQSKIQVLVELKRRVYCCAAFAIAVYGLVREGCTFFFRRSEEDAISQQCCFSVPEPLCVCCYWHWKYLSRCMCTPCI